MMIMDTFGPRHNIRQAFTSDTEKLRQAIENLSVVHTPASLKAVFDSVAVYASVPGAQVAQNPDAVGVVFISDNFGTLPNSAIQFNFKKSVWETEVKTLQLSNLASLVH